MPKPVALAAGFLLLASLLCLLLVIRKNSLVGSPFNLKVAPNPANELINVSFIGIDDDGVTLQIVNAIGKVVLTMNVLDSGNHSIDISNFEKGVYLLWVNNSNYSETQKIIKK